MKFTNISKLLIKFIGGGLVNFPTRYLKEVEVEAEGGENDGGGNSDNLSIIAKSINASLPSSVPQPVGIYFPGIMSNIDGKTYEVIYDFDSVVTKGRYSNNLDADDGIIYKQEVPGISKIDTCLLYPSGTVLTNGMLLDPFYKDRNYPGFIGSINYFDDNEEYGLIHFQKVL